MSGASRAPLMPPSPASTVRGRPTSSRVVSTGALMMVSWTPITPARSLKASRVFRTMWMQPWPCRLIATVAGSGSTSSKGNSTGSMCSSSSPVERSAKAAPRRTSLHTLP
uniref:(northern house mosquito) hypothetical protein n=1 Tax=Culex pipiens TaxID=7175 RepID=A0A8D8IV22_CULPI